MHPQLSPETEAAIAELVGRISVVRSHDAAIRAELAGHLREKIHAYLSGEETLTQADAVILARAHFGSPATVTRMMRRAHRRHIWRPAFFAGLRSTTLAFVWAMSLAYALAALVYVPLIVFPAAWKAFVSPGGIAEFPCQITQGLMCLTTLLLFWAALRLPFARKLWDQPTWRGWSLCLAAGITVNLIAIVLYARLFGAWSDPQHQYPGIFLMLLPQDALSLPYDWIALFIATASAGCIAWMFLKAAGSLRSNRETAIALAFWLAAALVLRLIIVLTIECMHRQYGSAWAVNNSEWLWHAIVKFGFGFSVQHFSVATVAIIIVAAILWYRRRNSQDIVPETAKA